MTESQKNERNNKGFTLMELVLVMVVLGVFGTFFAQVIFTTGEAYRGVTVREELLRSGKIALQRMVREMRHVGSRTKVDVLVLSPQEFSFRTWDGTQITYALSGDTITRNGVDLVDNVSSLSFTYYKRDGLSTTVKNRVNIVKIAFTLSKGGETVPFVATAFPLAFKYDVIHWYEE